MAHVPQRRTTLVLLALGLFFLFVTAAPAPNNLEEKAYEQVQAVMKTVLQRFPPSEYHYISLGRSPAPFAAYLDAARPGLVTHLPLSEFYARPGTDTALDAGAEKRVFDHFDAALKDAPIGKKKMLVIDFVVGGGSLVASVEYLEKYMAERRKLPGPIEALAIAAHENPERIPKDKKNIHVMAIENDYRILATHLNFSMLKYKAKFDRFAAPFDNSNEVLSKPSPEYEDLVRHFKKTIPEGCMSWIGSL